MTAPAPSERSVQLLTVMAAIANDPTCGPEWQARYAAAFERSRAYILREWAALAEAESEDHRAESAKASRPMLRLVFVREPSEPEEQAATVEARR